MTSTFVAVVGVAVCGAVGILGYLTHMFVRLLQTEVEFMKTVAVRQEEKAKRINRAARTVEKVGAARGDDTRETPTGETNSDDDARDSFHGAKVSPGSQS